MSGEGAPLPDVGDAELAPFWEGCRLGELRIPRCGACGAWVWYPRRRCPRCRAAGLAWTAVRGRGRLFTWVTVRRAFVPGFAGRVPFVTGLVELDEDPSIRLAAWLDVPDGAPLRAGDALEVFFERVDDEVTLPRFRPYCPNR